jgi:dihydrofolate reductase
MDGVMQAPGGSKEDEADGFKYGGWQYRKFNDPVSKKILDGWFAQPFELLLGRITYDIFAVAWPKAQTDQNVALPFNATKKYVVTHDKDFKATWEHSTVISGDVVSEIKKLKEMDGPDLWVWGSGNLIQTLLKENLIDQMIIMTHPVTIGSGKRLFADGTQPATWKLIDSTVTPKGVIFATYEPNGELKTGTVGA